MVENKFEYKVLITTSGIGSRLFEFTDFTNKSLVRIGRKPAISHIIDKYPIGTNFVIALGHFGDNVKQYLEIAYDDIKFEFINVDNYDKEGSSLLYSLLQCESVLKCPFIFHSCDTIIEENVPIPNHNFLITSLKDDSSQYRTVGQNDNTLRIIYDKASVNINNCYIGICGVYDYSSFWKNANELYNSDSLNGSLSDADVLNRMLKYNNIIEVINFDKWYDTGNIKELTITKNAIGDDFHILDKRDENIFICNNKVIKYFNNKNINLNRVKRTKYINNLTPDIISYSDNFYKYNYVDGNLFSSSVNEETFLYFLNWSFDKLWDNFLVNGFSKVCEDFYIKKTYDRISKYLKGNKDTSYKINGLLVPEINDLMKMINVNYITSDYASKFHGDFILDNIIETKDGFKLIDWRQDFGGILEYGDMYYDLSKLNHNLIINHDIVNKKLYTIKFLDNGDVICDIMCNKRLIDCRDVLHRILREKGYDINRLEIITSLIWINMSPLHEYPFNDFLFNFGKYNLYKNIIKNV